jgi:hypothetical protein
LFSRAVLDFYEFLQLLQSSEVVLLGRVATEGRRGIVSGIVVVAVGSHKEAYG